MSPNHHPPLAELLEYSAGVTPEWLSLMWACHLTLCPHCRNELSWLDQLGGALLEPAGGIGGVASASIPMAGRAVPAASAPGLGQARLAEPLAGRVPQPLHRHVRDAPGRWEPLRPGIEQVPLTIEANGIPLRLVRLSPGLAVERHEHVGVEWFLVLDGSIDCSLTGQSYHRGDVCWNEPGTVHHQRVGQDEPCLAVVAMTHRYKPVS